MPFGLKNVGATYQRAMVALFHDMIHHEIEVYVYDMIARSQIDEEHVDHLHKLFERLKKYKLRLNPNKCTFGVRSGKLLGLVVSGKVIEVNPAKVKDIKEKSAPCTEKEVRGFLRRLNYIARFISHLTATCEPIFKLLNKVNYLTLAFSKYLFTKQHFLLTNIFKTNILYTFSTIRESL